MNPDPNQAKAIFLEAVEKHAPDAWPAFLDRACVGQPDLRRRVEVLLDAHREAGTAQPQMPDAAGSVPTTARESAAELGAVIGPYKLIQEIGEGGMGTVYMAQQTEPVKRIVAVKLIKAGMDSKQVIARFEAERQALALMDHANIARVLDAGTSSAGRPYFVMDLVKGVPITKYCDEHHLTPRQRLELFIPVCQAIQHAHQKGVIHRDLKPSNVLVALYDGKPVPKVIDFGVAKAAGQSLTEKTLVTGFGNIVGTLEYMSPEQAEINQLDIDTRSDIYSLGVVLYELLTGSPPFTKKDLEKAGMLEMLRVIREKQPTRPSTKLSTAEGLPTLAANRGTEPAKLSKLLRGEMDWIVMKALEKDRNRRYETANGFAMDMQRYLADEPVQASPPSASYRLRKFVRRNKGPVLAILVIFLLLIAGIVGTGSGLVRAVSARQDAVNAQLAEEKQAERERLARQEADAREAEVRAVLDFVENQVFAAARPQGQSGGLGRDVTLRLAVEAALPFITESFTNQPLIEARLRLTLGLSLYYLGEWQTAAEQFEAAHRLLAHHRGPTHPDTLLSMSHLADSYDALGRYVEAFKLREETLALRKSKLGPVHPDTLTSVYRLSLSYYALGEHAEALRLTEEALALQKARLGPDHAATLTSMNNLAFLYQMLGRHAEALTVREETLSRRKTRLGPNHPDTLASMRSLAGSYSYLGRHAEQLRLIEETLKLQKTKLGNEHPHTLMSRSDLARAYENLGRYTDAAKLDEEVLALQQRKLGPDHPHALWTMYFLANDYHNLGRHAEALKLNEETLRLRTAKLGLYHPDTIGSMGNLADSYSILGRHAEAVKLLEEILPLYSAKEAPSKRFWCMLRLASSLAKLDRGPEAVAISREAAESYEKLQRADARGLYNAASFRAVTAAVVRAADNSPEGAKQANAEADRAMAWLKKAIAAGFNSPAYIKNDPDFDSLRHREDFKRLVTELEANKKP